MTEVLNADNCLTIPKTVTDEYGYVFRSKGSNIGRTFLDTTPNVSVKSEYTRGDYDYYRKYETSERTAKENIELCLRAYDKVGIVRNVIDLMSDFVCKGIKLVHPIASQERFYNQWFEYIDGFSVSERFVNYLYRIGNVPVNIAYSKVPVKIVKKWSSVHGSDLPIEEIERTEKRRIPTRYTFINPLSLEVLYPELAAFTGRPIYALRISRSVVTDMNRLQYDQKLDADKYTTYIPDYIVDKLNAGDNLVVLDSDNIKIYFYRKDDWKVWADSMIVAVLDDLIVLDKMKLADISALDGAISTVRLWTLGYIGETPQTTLMPTNELLLKVRGILANNVGGGTIDLVWGPDLKMTETNSQVYKFLGKAKYEPVLASIYEGLGVPFISDSAGKGMTNNFIQMQTFVERLQYGRRILTSFWNEEIKKIQLAMGYNKPAKLSFDQVNLGDDSVYKTNLLGLLDRDIISADAVLNNFGMFSDIERIKIEKEQKLRDNKRMRPKASPFHSPQNEHEMKKLLIQGGGVAPSEVGLELNPRKDGEEPLVDKNYKQQLELADRNNKAKIEQAKYRPKGATNGRPKGKKDATKRAQKRAPIHTKGFVNTFLWGCNAQAAIADKITPILLKSLYNKPNVRSLSNEEVDKLELTKFIIFSHLAPFSEVTDETIVALASQHQDIQPDVAVCTKALLFSFSNQNGRKPTADEMRQIQSCGFAVAYDDDTTTYEKNQDEILNNVTSLVETA